MTRADHVTTTRPGWVLSAILVAFLVAGCTTTPSKSDRQTSSLRPEIAPLAENGRAVVAFEPVIGPPAEAASRLGPAIGSAAITKGVTVVPAGGDGATVRIKGYLATSASGSGAAIVYHWDVLDRNGTRVYRISGREPAARTGDPWTALDDATAIAIASKTMDALKSILERS